MTVALPRAFAVWFTEVTRWSVRSFFAVDWQWPPGMVLPLSHALERKVAPPTCSEPIPPMVTLHFNGEMEVRNLSGKRGIKGRLVEANPGDVLYSKIDVRNGAIGVVPESMPRVAVTTEFPVYSVRREVAHPEYIKLVVRTGVFRRQINSMISGASGRKRVQPVDLEKVQIPIPPLAIQQAILKEWQKARQAVAEAEERIHRTEAEIEERFFVALGLKTLPKTKPPKCFAVELQNTISWNVRANFLNSEATLLRLGRYPVVSGRECLHEVKHGSSAPPSPRPSSLYILKISAVTRGEFVPSERKFAFDTERVRREFCLRQGDVLMCRTNGTLAYVGMSALVYDDMPNLIFPDKVIRVRTKDNLEPGYLWYVLQTHHLRLQIEAVARTAVGNYAIGSDDIWNLRIPLPPLDVQRRIVADVEAGRARIAHERETARALSLQIEADVEAYLLGTKKVGTI